MFQKKIWVLRLTHRLGRDKRVTTHLALVARAFGSSGMYYSGDKDPSLESKINDVCRRWGGDFKIIYIDSPTEIVSKWKDKDGLVIHLTMYGLPLPKIIDIIREHNNILVIVGSEKVKRIYYKLADFNISVTNQPHSEIAALALFLDYFYKGSEFNFDFNRGRFRVMHLKKRKK